MSRDRLAELDRGTNGRSRQQPQMSQQPRIQQRQQQGSYQQRSGQPSSPRRGAATDFNGISDEIQQGIENIRRNTADLQALHRRALAETNSQNQQCNKTYN